MITDIQKASISKRIAAGLLDVMLVLILAVGFAWLLSSILNYTNYSVQLTDKYEQYEQIYGVDFSISDSEQLALSEAEKANFNNAVDALWADKDVNNTVNMLLSLSLLIITFSLLLAILVIGFFVPLLLKNGQTLGKKVFSIGLVRVDGVQLTPVQLFVRSILGQFTIEVMVPIYMIVMILFGMVGIVGLIVVFGILLLQLIVMIASRNNSMIHDLLAGTVAVDISSQMVFRTPDDLIAYKKKIHAEQAARSNY